MSFIHALTVDLEEWYDPPLVRPFAPAKPPSLVVEATRPVLDLFRRYGVRATFFVVGRVGRDHPDLLRAIQGDGHEIACHGYSHRPLWELTPDTFRKELRSFACVAKEVLGIRRTDGFRAPMFSLDESTAWAIEILREFDYLYDSSIFPIQNPYYGVSRAPREPYRMAADSLAEPAEEGLVEFPLTTWRIAGQNIPLAGGFYLRLLPRNVLIAGLQRVARERPLILYVHPWELSPSTPRLRLPYRHRFITYYGGGSAWNKLERLLQEFRFTRLDHFLSDLCLAPVQECAPCKNGLINNPARPTGSSSFGGICQVGVFDSLGRQPSTLWLESVFTPWELLRKSERGAT